MVNVFDSDRLDNSRLCNTIPNTGEILVLHITCTRALIGQGVEIKGQTYEPLSMAEVEVYSADKEMMLV